MKASPAPPPAETPKPTGGASSPSTAPPSKPQLRIVSVPSNKAASGALQEEPAAQSNSPAIPPPPPAPPLPRRRARQTAGEELRRKREVHAIEQQQEEDARQIKQTAASSLSQRLAQTNATKPTADQAATQATQPLATRPTTEAALPRNSGSLTGIPAPRVRTAPLPPNRASGALQASGSNSGKLSMPSSAAVAVASGLREHPQASLFLRAAAMVLACLLLGSGAYFYRNQKAASANAPLAERNLLSPEDQSEQLIQTAERARQGGQLETAAANLSKAIELTPEQPGPRQLLAETFEGAGRTDEALKAYDSLLRLTPDNLSARLKVAEIYRTKGNVNEARTQYQRIIALNQTSPEATRALEAIEELEDAAPSSTPGNPAGSRPRRVAGRKMLGPVLPPSTAARSQVVLIPQNPFAAPGARSLLDFNPLRPLEMPDPRVVAAYHKDRGRRYNNIGQFGAAVKELHEAIRLTPGDKDLYYFLGSSYKGLGQLLKAFEYFRKCDGGTYAEVAQSSAKQIEKPARKELERQQKELEKATQAKEAEARKEMKQSKSFQNSFQEQ